MPVGLTSLRKKRAPVLETERKQATWQTEIVSPKDFPRASEAAPQVKVLAGEEKRRDSRATEDMAWRHRC